MKFNVLILFLLTINTFNVKVFYGKANKISNLNLNSISSKTVNSNNKESYSKMIIVDRNIFLFPKASTLKDGDNGNIFKLTEHKIDCKCSTLALKGFQLIGNSESKPNDIAYQWKCIKVNLTNGKLNIVPGLLDNKKIRISDMEKRDSAHRLAELEVRCPENAVIKSFVLQNDGENIFYKTECIMANIHDCKKEETESKNVKDNYINARSIIQLNQFAIIANNGRAIQSVKAISNKDYIKYAYVTCDITKTNNAKNNLK